MEIFDKKGNELILIYDPVQEKDPEVGTNFLVFDSVTQRGLLVFIIEQNLVNVPGILEELVRTVGFGKVVTTTHVPPELGTYLIDVKNMKFARAKIIKEINLNKDNPDKSKITNWTGWIPTRNVQIKKLDDKTLIPWLEFSNKYLMTVGVTRIDKHPFKVNAGYFQGILLVVGKKGSGKSHLVKIITLEICDHGGKFLIFDINNEYASLGKDPAGKPNKYYNCILNFTPGDDLKFTLEYVGLPVFTQILFLTGIDETRPQYGSFRSIWLELENAGTLNTTTLRDEIQTRLVQSGQSISQNIGHALLRRLKLIFDTGLFTDHPASAVRLEKEFKNIKKGGAIVINLKGTEKLVRDIVVRTMLEKVSKILEDPKAEPLFLLAEESQLYFEERVFENLITRMRHLGLYQIYVTNTPTALRDIVIRQTDNIFLFRLSSENDVRHLIAAIRLDREAIFALTNSLPFRTCLAIGTCTNEYPFLVEPRELDVLASGKTRLLFPDYKEIDDEEEDEYDEDDDDDTKLQA
ncbi:MAG: ATP-binding protein [Candidatus Helarchaeota archaeon]